MNDSAVTTSTRSLEQSALAAALNDSTQGGIGNPRRGQYHAWIAITGDSEREVLTVELEQLDIEHRINTRQRDGQRYIAIYNVPGLRKMLEALGPQLAPERREALDMLVRARSPIPDEILDAIWRRYQLDGWDEEQIAKAMIEKPIIDGMGKGWTPRKIRRILAEI
jgi:hypothetical protein